MISKNHQETIGHGGAAAPIDETETSPDTYPDETEGYDAYALDAGSESSRLSNLQNPGTIAYNLIKDGMNANEAVQIAKDSNVDNKNNEYLYQVLEVLLRR